MSHSARQRNFTQSKKFLLVFEFRDNTHEKRYFIKEECRYPMNYKEAITVGKRLSIINPDMRFTMVEIDNVIDYPHEIMCPNCGIEIT